MCPKPPRWSLALLLCVAVFLAWKVWRDEVVGIGRITPIWSSAPLDQTVSNVVDVLRMQGCSIAVSNDAAYPANTCQIIYFRSTACSGTVKVDAYMWDAKDKISVTYMIDRRFWGSEDDIRRLARKLDALEEEVQDMP